MTPNNKKNITSISVNINGREIPGFEGETVLDVAKRADIEIPTLCHDDRLDPSGCCRMCLVEVEGQRRLQPACAWKATDGQVVTTETTRIERHRTALTSLYMADHDSTELHSLAPNNILKQQAKAFGATHIHPINSPRETRQEINPYIHFDPDLCILCARCVRYCDEVEGVSAITLVNRGAETTISTANSIGLLDSDCELCGGCIDTCPTGAMREKKPINSLIAFDAPVEVVRTTCNFCGVGCQLDLHVSEGEVQKVTSPEGGTTLNDGNLCVKGRFSYDFIHHDDRLTHPLIRGDDGELHKATWPEAIAAVSKGLRAVQKRHGSDSLGFISSSRCTSEENYLLQKMARAAFGTNNCHQCAAT